MKISAQELPFKIVFGKNAKINHRLNLKRHAVFLTFH